MGMTEVYLALGSNVGDSRQQIVKAVEMLSKHLHHLKQAPLYHSKAVDYTEQPDFLNTAVSGQTTLEPLQLFHALKAIEQQIGRTKTFRWGPREIDIDIIFYGDTVLDSAELTIPHARFRERAFVLQPIYDLSPAFVDPRSGLSVEQLLKALPAEQLNSVRMVDPTD